MNAPDPILSKSAAQPAKKRATYADLEAVPPHLVAEIIDGDLVSHPRPAPRHSAASSALGSKLSNPFQFGEGGPGGWVFLGEPELHFGPEVVVPDIAGWRRERLSRAPETAYLEIAPDWLCEVISPSTETYDRGPKRRIYAEAGVSHLWLLDPRVRLLEVFALAAGNWVLLKTYQDADEVSAPPFDAIGFSLGVLWPFDTPDQAQTETQDKPQG
ncbi:MAG TPA: Uma2 family endonuclease [Afifellaceae bacterium]|nr:Uma2 family endonuclease [Afifellaceae bacterium]